MRALGGMISPADGLLIRNAPRRGVSFEAIIESMIVLLPRPVTRANARVACDAPPAPMIRETVNGRLAASGYTLATVAPPSSPPLAPARRIYQSRSARLETGIIPDESISARSSRINMEITSATRRLAIPRRFVGDGDIVIERRFVLAGLTIRRACNPWTG